MVARGKDPAGTVYDLRVVLAGSDLPIWRRVQVTGATTLARLHTIIQIVMDWQDYHLHEFDIRGGRFGDPAAELEGPWGEPITDEAKVRLIELALTPGTVFEYAYDFGDNWVHEIEVEEVLQAEPDAGYPVCTDGSLAAPPEDVGGIWGYYDVLDAVSDPSHEEHEHWSEWLGEWDPEAFDIEQINQRLRKLGRRKR